MDGVVTHRRALLTALGTCVIAQAVSLVVGLAGSVTPLIYLGVLLTFAALTLLVLTVASFAGARGRSS